MKLNPELTDSQLFEQRSIVKQEIDHLLREVDSQRTLWEAINNELVERANREV